MRNWILVLGVAVTAILSSGCKQLQSRDKLNKGVAAFKNAQYAEAVEMFKKAVDLDPNFPTARLYLATAYMQQYIPGSDSPENVQMAQAAHDHFMKVLEQNPKDEVAMASLGSLFLNQKKWDEAQQWYEKLTAINPNNKEAFYSLAFIAWSKWYPAYGTARANLGMRQEDPGPIKDKKVRDELKAQWGPVIDAGLAALDKALQIDPDYDDAMAYKNLLIRERADLMDTKAEYEAQVQVADQWIEKNLATKKKKAEEAAKKGGGGITMDQK
jgi:tetratricopeptide (TPR) repeat protein